MCQGGFVPHRNYQESGRVSAKAREREGAWARGRVAHVVLVQGLNKLQSNLY